MKFNEAKCPKCGGILQVPGELEKLNCMYCGKEIYASELMNVTGQESHKSGEAQSKVLQLWEQKDPEAIVKAKELFQEDNFNYTANYVLAMDSLPKVLLEHRGLINEFKAKLYEDAMKRYIEDSRHSLEYLEKACVVKQENRSTLLEEAAKTLVQAIKEDMLAQVNHNPKKLSAVIDDYKMVLVLFTIPMILELHLDISDALADNIIKAWIEEFPKSIIKKGTFESINGGFRKKGFCYITTAVCDTLHKSDDCYELTMFRSFRDDYLLKQEDGSLLIEEYYHMAPMIVHNINQLEDCSEVYQSIWKNYLKGCLYAIESGDEALCKEMYCTMVRDLQKEYLQ